MCDEYKHLLLYLSLSVLFFANDPHHQIFDWGSELLHGPVGAYIAESEFGITNEDMLNAIRFHTTGRAGMSKFEKILFVADMIEPNRLLRRAGRTGGFLR